MAEKCSILISCCFSRLLVALTLFLGSASLWASNQGNPCAGPGWPSEVSYSAGSAPGEAQLHFGPPIVPVGAQYLSSSSVNGNRIDLAVVGLDSCLLGIILPLDTMAVPFQDLAPGQYLVTVRVDNVEAGSVSAQDLPLTVTGPVGSIESVPALTPSVLGALGIALLAMGVVLSRGRASS